MPVNGQQQEVVYEGWLTKSPPTKRIWRARWRRRWFSLRHSGELPGQFRLTYYTDRNCRKLKGIIDLDHCEQVDLGLKHEERKLKFDHVFDIKTPTRTYYLAADSENEMKSWVNCICKVCGLKSTSEEEEDQGSHVVKGNEDEIIFCEENLISNESPPVSPVSTSPYIPISECITGRSPILEPQDFKALLQCNLKNSILQSDLSQNETSELTQRTYLNFVSSIDSEPKFYDCPRQLTPYLHQTMSIKKQDTVIVGKDEGGSHNTSPLQSPTDSESVFTDDDWILNSSSDLDLRKCSTRPSDSSADLDMTVVQKFTKLGVHDQKTVLVPPRPPKPNKGGPNYLNISPLNKTSRDVSENENVPSETKSTFLEEQKISDEMYDFPRSHVVDVMEQAHHLPRRHCYNNAAPIVVDGHIFRYDNISPKPGTSTAMFKYDPEDAQDDPSSPLSQRSSTTVLSNLPSPCLSDLQLMSPPVVNRDLKPKCKLSDSVFAAASQCPADSLPSPLLAPCIDRKLKPPAQMQLTEHEDCSNHKFRNAVPSPTLPTETMLENLYQNNEEEIYHYLPSNKNMQYLDLDLEGSSALQFSDNVASISLRSSATNTVYKKVDFMKTEAFNITRNNLEKERKETVTFVKK